MIPHSGSRLAIITAFLVLQSLVFVFELLIFNKRVRRKSYYLPLRQLLGPTLIALLGIVIIPITFNHASRYITNAEKQCSANVDGDIAGEGTQIATWAQVGVLLVISGLGSFHTSATGAKEIGAGLVLTHISLAIAILIQMRLRTLNSANAVVGAMILDAQNVGLSIQLAAKETLAARWQVCVVVLAQVFGFVVVPVLVTNFAHGAFARGNCSCLTVFWWAWLSNCGSSAAREMPIFWTYYACRFVGLCQTSFHSLYNSPKFHTAEKSERPTKNMDTVDAELQIGLLPGMRQEADASNSDRPDPVGNHTQDKRTSSEKYASRSIRLRKVTYVYRRQNGQVACFKEYPATVTMMYAVHGVFSLTSMSAVQTTISNFNLGSPSPINSVGQIISLVVAAATLGRAAWLFLVMFWDEAREGKWHFVWPFKWRLAENTLFYWRHVTPEEFMLCYPFRHGPDCLSLGAILTEPFDPLSRIEVDCDIPEQEVREATEVHTRISVESVRRTLISEQTLKNDMVVDALTTSSFLPTHAYVAEQLQSLFVNFNGAQTVYLVTGLKVAKGFQMYESTSKSGAESRSADPRESRLDSPAGVLFAYRLHAIRRSRHKRVFLDGVFQSEHDW